MIVPMKKVVLVTTETRKSDSIAKLQDFGLLHIEQLAGSGERLEELKKTRDMVDRAIFTLSPDAPEESGGPSSFDAALELARRVNRQAERIRELSDDVERFERERERVVPWGDFDPLMIEELKKRGIALRLFELSAEQAKTAGTVKNLFPVRTTKSVRYVAVVDGGSLAAEGWKEFLPPEKPLSEIEGAIEDRHSQITHIQEELDRLSSSRNRLARVLNELDEMVQFENVVTGMHSEGTIVYLKGFIPEKRSEDIKKMAAKNGMGIIITDPDDEDQVPTLVENPKAISIIQPVFGMLGTIPGYHERDISLFFLIFFSIFFAMIIGDAGYGLIFLIPALLGMRSGRKKTGKVPTAMVLLTVLSSCTVVWGAITGTWFGSQFLAELPPLKALTIPAIASFGSEESSQVIKFICFVLGTIHLSIAHIWNFMTEVKKKPMIRAFAQLGWLSMVLGLFYLVLNLVLDAEKFPMPTYSIYMIIGGLAAVFLFGQQEGNFIKGVLKGIGGFLTTFLDSISAFSDIISYIRLFAVGLATVEIAKSFNAMASGLGNDVVGIIGSVLILLLGHGLNLAMGALSVIVHGIRLNVLEFSGHLGMEWTGVAYDPFRKKETK